MFIFTYVAALLGAVFLVVAFVFLRNTHGLRAYGLASYLFTAAVWIGGNAIADVSYTPFALIVSSDITFGAGIANVFCFFLLVDLLIDEQFPSLLRLASYGLPSLIVFVLAFTPLSIVTISFPSGSPAQILPGFPYAIALFILLAGIAYGIVRLYKTLRLESDYTRRMQLLYVFAGLIITGSGQVTFNLLLPILGITNLYTVGPITSLFFALGCGYAITRHHLFDIRIIVQRGLIYSILLGGTILTYLLILNTFAFVFHTDEALLLFVAGITTVLGIFTVPHVEQFFRKQTDAFLFKDRYKYADAMHILSEILATARTNHEIVHRVELALGTILRASSVTITLYGKSILVPESSKEQDGLNVPILLEDETIGSIRLGSKRSGDPYTSEDIQLLTTFVYQAATALSRVRLSEEVAAYAGVLEQKVEDRTQELRQLQESQRQTMIELSHNLQTPLTILQTKLERIRGLMLHDGDVLSLEQSLSGLSSFIYDLLDLSQAEQTDKAIDEDIDLSMCIAELVEEVAIIAAPKNIFIDARLISDLHIRGDRKRIRAAIMNLASNAMKYMKSEGSKNISFGLERNGSHALCTIHDTGIGISPQDVTRIFERFYRAGDAPHAIRGNGLGLAVVKQVIEQHHGTIAVESELGKGSCFTLTFPIAN